MFSYGTLIDKFDVETKRCFLTSNYRLGTYGQYPALIKDKKLHQIEGHLINLSNKELSKADHYEGYPKLYNRIELEIILDNKPVIAWVYILNPEHETKKMTYSIDELYKFLEDDSS